MESNAHPGPDVVQLSVLGPFYLDIPGTNTDGAEAGDLDITGDVTIRTFGLGGPGPFLIVARNGDRIFDVRPGAHVRIEGVTLTNGRAVEGGLVRNEGDLTIIRSDLRNGTASLNGGGIMLFGGNLVLQDSLVADNTASSNGGGLYDNQGTVQIQNVTFTGNTTSSVHAQGGGAIAAVSGTVGLVNVTIDHNSAATFGGGLVATTASTITLLDTIVAANTAPTGPNCAVAGGVIQTLGHNLESPLPVTSPCPLSSFLGDVIDQDPKLGPLVDTGGNQAGAAAALTRSIQASSAAIDRGTTLTSVNADGRHLSRPQDGNGDGIAISDIGAYEFQLPAGTFRLKPHGAAVHPGAPLRYALTWTVPAPESWHSLAHVDVRMCNGAGLWVRWDEASNTFRLVDPETGDLGTPGMPGSAQDLATPFATLHLADTRVVGTGVTGQSVTLELGITFTAAAAAQNCKVEVDGTDDHGHENGFQVAGNLRVQKR
jgi:hypothetical protein